MCITSRIQTPRRGPDSRAWPSSPTPDPAAPCFAAFPLILSCPCLGLLTGPQAPAFWTPCLCLGCFPHLECPWSLVIQIFPILPSTIRALFPLGSYFCLPNPVLDWSFSSQGSGPVVLF